MFNRKSKFSKATGLTHQDAAVIGGVTIITGITAYAVVKISNAYSRAFNSLVAPVAKEAVKEDAVAAS